MDLIYTDGSLLLSSYGCWPCDKDRNVEVVELVDKRVHYIWDLYVVAQEVNITEIGGNRKYYNV